MTNATSPDFIRERYERALAVLVEDLKKDRTILAAVLCGSLSHDTVWEKSDIDLMIVGDESHKSRTVSLLEDDINIHAQVLPRSGFRKLVDSSLQNSFMHSYLAKGRMLYTVDESLAGLLDDMQTIGERDRDLQLLAHGSDVLPVVAKARKWFHVRRDMRYTFGWIMHCVGQLARIEIISHRQIAGREVVQQALLLNPTFFGSVYTDLIDGPKDEATIEAALDAIDYYLESRIDELYGLLLAFLAEAGGPRSMTEINAHFRPLVHEGVDSACEWLAERGIIQKIGTPLRLCEKSRVTVNEAAYYYDGPEA